MADINVFAWVAKQVGADKLVKWGWKTANWTTAWNAYEKRIKEDYGKLFVLGKADPVPLENIYTVVNVLEKPSAERRYSPEQLHELFLKREALWLEGDKRRSGIDLVKTGKNLYILGKPGAGKTTFLKNVAIKTVDGSIGGKSPEMIPLFISLHAHANSERTLLESIEHELSSCGFPDVPLFVNYLLHSERALILLDGLDEVKQEDKKRSKLIQEIKDFMRKYRESQFLMTCRVAATEYEFDNVTYLEMADFDNKQIKTFVEKWFNNTEQGQKCLTELNKEENKGLLELARVPLLLTLLTLTYEETQTFPNRRVEIYEEALDALLKKWDARRNIQRDEPYRNLSLGRKRQLFARIATEMFETKEFLTHEAKLAKQITDYMQKLPDAKDEVDGQAILHSIAAQHGIFVERATKIYSFAHLSFQEYYTAKYIVDNSSSGTLESLLKHLGKDQWREVFLLTASLLDEKTANTFFKLMVNQLNEIALHNEKLNAILELAYKKARLLSSIVSYKPVAMRAYSLYVLLGTRFYDDRKILKLSLDLDKTFDSHRNLIREIHQAYANALLHKVDPDTELRRLHELFLGISGEYDITNILKKLGALENLTGNPPNLKMTKFTETVKDIYHEFRGLTGINHIISKGTSIQFNWTQKEKEMFLLYSDAAQLLIDCLQLAIVSDRESIINQLFLSVQQS